MMNEYCCWDSKHPDTNQPISADNALYAADIYANDHIDWGNTSLPIHITVKDVRGHIHKFGILCEGSFPEVLHITQ